MAVGALEPQFFAQMALLLGIDAEESDRADEERWPDLRATMTLAFGSRTRAEWTNIFEGSDACVAPVLSLVEAAQHPHLADRGVFIDVGGVLQPAPEPRFSRTATAMPEAPPAPGAHTVEILKVRGAFSVDDLLEAGFAVQA